MFIILLLRIILNFWEAAFLAFLVEQNQLLAPPGGTFGIFCKEVPYSGTVR